jgi:cob(I)alamin adenosyltransferase
MKLYKRTGDRGFTMLPAGDGKGVLRVRKDDPRLEALGAVDELGAAVGMCAVEAARVGNAAIQEALVRVQDELFRLGAVVAGVGADSRPRARLGPAAVTRMEKQIDAIWAEMGGLKHFVLPGGCELAARLHVARAAARRAERAAVTALGAHVGKRSRAAAGTADKYLNRLSDLLFALARKATRDSGVPEATWAPRKAADAASKKRQASGGDEAAKPG